MKSTLIQNLTTKCRRSFTLIEMLVVIAIIGILIALLFPAIKSALAKAESNQAHADVMNIQSAIKQFNSEYGRWPNANGNASDYSYGNMGFENPCNYNGGLMDTLRAIADSGGSVGADGFPTCGNGNHVSNPHRIVFLQTTSRKNAFDSNNNFLDPWGNQYEITINTSGTGNCRIMGGAYGIITNQQVCVWSRGPDGISTTASNTDDVLSWQ